VASSQNSPPSSPIEHAPAAGPVGTAVVTLRMESPEATSAPGFAPSDAGPAAPAGAPQIIGVSTARQLGEPGTVVLQEQANAIHSASAPSQEASALADQNNDARQVMPQGTVPPSCCAAYAGTPQTAESHHQPVAAGVTASALTGNGSLVTGHSQPFPGPTLQPPREFQAQATSPAAWQPTAVASEAIPQEQVPVAMQGHHLPPQMVQQSLPSSGHQPVPQPAPPPQAPQPQPMQVDMQQSLPQHHPGQQQMSMPMPDPAQETQVISGNVAAQANISPGQGQSSSLFGQQQSLQLQQQQPLLTQQCGFEWQP